MPSHPPTLHISPPLPPQGVVNWVAQPAPNQDPPQFEARLYGVLFNSEEPGELDDWLGDLNRDSKQVLSKCFANPVLSRAQVGDRYGEGNGEGGWVGLLDDNISLSISHTLTHNLSLSHTHTHTLTHTLSHTHSLSHTLSLTQSINHDTNATQSHNHAQVSVGALGVLLCGS